MGSGFRVQGLGFRVECLGFRGEGSEFRVQGSGFQGLLALSVQEHARALIASARAQHWRVRSTGICLPAADDHPRAPV